MLDVAVIEEPAAAAVTLDPKRARLLAEMAEPVSAATLAARVGLPRQKVNYHLRTLEKHGLARVAEERRWGGLTERRLVATARSYVVSPAALGPLASDPDRAADRLSASYLIALGARIVREVSGFLRRSAETGKRLATLSIDTEIRFASPRRGPGSAMSCWPRSVTWPGATTTNPPPGGAATGWWSSPIPLRRLAPPRRQHERQDRSIRPPIHPRPRPKCRARPKKSGKPSPPDPASVPGSTRPTSTNASAATSATTRAPRWTTFRRK